MRIRKAHLQDSRSIKALYLSAFSKDECEVVANLALKLLSEITIPETFALVAEMDDNVIGHIAFSPVTQENISNCLAYILAPLAVSPEFQKQGIGTRLMESGINHLFSVGVNILFVYGDPQYYGRFGFNADLAARYIPPYELEYDFGWQAMYLTEIKDIHSTIELTCVESLMNPQLW